jgi:hypothetical protein
VIERQWSLEGRVERLGNALASLQQQVQAIQQQLWQAQGHLGVGGSGDLLGAVLTASLSAGSTGSPATAAGTLLVPNGSGGLTSSGGASITIQSYFATAISVSGSKFCWVQADTQSGNYNLVVADC